MQIADNVIGLIGHTPMVKLKRFSAAMSTVLVAKVESYNPGGSVKDRAAIHMIARAEEKGILNKDTVIVEPTSGNTGIGLAMVSAIRGYHIVLTMPDTMSLERRNLLKAYGADVVLTPGAQGMQGAIAKAQELAAKYPKSWMPGQFTNADNANAHYLTTGPEIWEDTEGGVDIFVAGIGTGGVITGVGSYLKQQKDTVYIVGVEPGESPVLSGGQPGVHDIQGIGAGFVPEVLQMDIVDEIIPVQGTIAMATARRLGKEEGLLVGISSGAVAWAGLQLAQRPENQDKTIVILLPDTGERYLSTALFAEQ